MVQIEVQPDSLVLLVGMSGSGKTTFARRYFPADVVLSSDAMRALVAGDEGDQAASRDAFRVLHDVTAARLRRGLLTVIDATNLSARSRRPFLDLARRWRRPAYAIVLDVEPTVAAARNASRAERVVLAEVLDEQQIKLDMAIASLPGEGYAAWHVIRSPEDVERIAIVGAAAEP